MAFEAIKVSKKKGGRKEGAKKKSALKTLKKKRAQQKNKKLAGREGGIGRLPFYIVYKNGC